MGSQGKGPVETLICIGEAELWGAARWRRARPRAELVALAIEPKRRGVGRRLVAEVAERARQDGARGLGITVPEHRESAVHFVEACGFRPIAIHEGAVDEARPRDPDTPGIEAVGDPVRDEIEYDLHLGSG